MFPAKLRTRSPPRRSAASQSPYAGGGSFTAGVQQRQPTLPQAVIPSASGYEPSASATHYQERQQLASGASSPQANRQQDVYFAPTRGGGGNTSSSINTSGGGVYPLVGAGGGGGSFLPNATLSTPRLNQTSDYGGVGGGDRQYQTISPPRSRTNLPSPLVQELINDTRRLSQHHYDEPIPEAAEAAEIAAQNALKRRELEQKVLSVQQQVSDLMSRPPPPPQTVIVHTMAPPLPPAPLPLPVPRTPTIGGGSSQSFIGGRPQSPVVSPSRTGRGQPAVATSTVERSVLANPSGSGDGVDLHKLRRDLADLEAIDGVYARRDAPSSPHGGVAGVGGRHRERTAYTPQPAEATLYDGGGSVSSGGLVARPLPDSVSAQSDTSRWVRDRAISPSTRVPTPMSPPEIEAHLRMRAEDRGAIQGEEQGERRLVREQEEEGLDQLYRHAELLFHLAAKEDNILKIRLKEAEEKLERHRRRWLQGERHRGQVVGEINREIDSSYEERDRSRARSASPNRDRSDSNGGYNESANNNSNLQSSMIGPSHPAGLNNSVTNRSIGVPPPPHHHQLNSSGSANNRSPNFSQLSPIQPPPPPPPSSYSGSSYVNQLEPVDNRPPGAKLNESLDQIAHMSADASLRSLVGGTSAGPGSAAGLRRTETAPYNGDGSISSRHSPHSSGNYNYNNDNNGGGGNMMMSGRQNSGESQQQQQPRSPYSSMSNRSVQFNMTSEQENAVRQTEEQIKISLATSERRRRKEQLMNETLSRPTG